MYRQKIAECDEAPEQFITKLQSLPVVSSAVGRIFALYTGTKEHNRLFRFTLETAESGFGLVINSAKPVIEKFEKPIGHLNDIACGQLNKLEHDYPIITKPTEEVLKATSDTCSLAVKPITDRVESAKGYGIGKVSDVKNFTYGKIDSVKGYTYDKMGGVKDKIDSVKGYTCDKMGGVKVKIDSVKGYTYDKMGGVKDKIDSVKGYTYDKVGGVKGYTCDKIDGVRNYGCEKLCNIRSYSADKLKSAKEYSTDRVSRAQELGAEYVNQMMEHRAHSALTTRFDTVLDVAHNYIDFYLPEEPDSNRRELLQDMTEEELKKKKAGTMFMKSVELAETLRRRMYARLRKQLHAMREGSIREKMFQSKLLIPTDFLTHVRHSCDGVKDRVVFIWTEINKKEEEEEREAINSEKDFNNQTMERRLIATARHLTHRIRNGLTTIQERYMPEFMTQFIHQAQAVTLAYISKGKLQGSQIATEHHMKTTTEEVSDNHVTEEEDSSASSECHGNDGRSAVYDESMNSTQDYSSNEDQHY